MDFAGPYNLGLSAQSIRTSTKAHALVVAAGILLSRLVGLVRDRIFAHYFGNSDAADAFRAAFRIPNFLQNLFGEGVLSASFIPVYARLNAEERHEEASQLAEAIFALLLFITTVLVVVGVVVTPWLIDLIAPGFHGDKRLLTIRLVQVLFPGAAMLVLSAWCLGILNSHRKFFLSYTAPVIWNLAMIATLVWGGRGHAQPRLAVLVAIGSVVGSGLQFAVQLPTVLRYLWPLRLQLRVSRRTRAHGEPANFFPVFLSRGVVQISAYIDAWLGSFLGTGAVSALGYAQTLYTLPVSLFGMAVSAAELPAMSSALGTQDEIASVAAAAADTGHSADCVLCDSIGGRLCGARRRDCGHHLPLGRVPAQRRAVCVGSAGGVGSGAARLDDGAAVFIGLLCTARHAHSAELRGHSCCTYAWPGVRLRAAAATAAGARSALGSGRVDRLCRCCWMD